MKKTLIAGIVIAFVLGSVLTLVSINAEEGLIPAWIKSTAGFWVNDKISDSEFIAALQYLVKEGILVIPEKSTASEPSSIVTPKPSTTVIPTPSVITKKYQPNLESFIVEGDTVWLLINILDGKGKPVSISGDVTTKILNFDDKEIFKDKKYITSDSYEDFKNNIAGKSTSGFQWNIPSGKVSGGLYKESLYNNGLGTLIITLQETGQSYESKFKLSHLPINEGYFNKDTGFLDNFKVNQGLDVGPFYITVSDVGRYIGEDVKKGNAPKEFFRVNLNTKFKFVEEVTFKLDEIFIKDKNNNLYTTDEISLENYKNTFFGKSYEYEGGNGYVLFEKIPSDVSNIKLTIKITRIEGDVSDTHYEDEIEIPLS